MAKKRRTAAQIRATRKLVAMNKARARSNPKRRKNAAGPRKTPLRRLKSALQLRRGRKATAKWVRSGMPAQRNATREYEVLVAGQGAGTFLSLSGAQGGAK